MTAAILALKIDIDTDRGTRLGVPPLLRLFAEFNIHATFLFSLGPDNTGRAIRRIFRPGFFRKVARTNVLGMYGLRTLLNGVLLPGPDIGKRNAPIMRAVRDAGHEVGVHCYDHIRWQDGLAYMSHADVQAEFAKALAAFERIFEEPARTAGAAGWQANRYSLEVYDAARLDYASDARGERPFYPRVGEKTFRTLQVPTTLPTLDELLGRPEYPESQLIDHYLHLMRADRPNVYTGHAEIEGMSRLGWFRRLLTATRAKGVKLCAVRDVAAAALARPTAIPAYELYAGTVEGRSGTLAVARGTA